MRLKSCRENVASQVFMVVSSATSVSPHLLVTVLLQRRLSVALLPLRSLLLFLFGLRGQDELLRYLLLGDGARLPGGVGGGKMQINNGRKEMWFHARAAV